MKIVWRMLLSGILSVIVISSTYQGVGLSQQQPCFEQPNPSYPQETVQFVKSILVAVKDFALVDINPADCSEFISGSAERVPFRGISQQGGKLIYKQIKLSRHDLTSYDPSTFQGTGTLSGGNSKDLAAFWVKRIERIDRSIQISQICGSIHAPEGENDELGWSFIEPLTSLLKRSLGFSYSNTFKDARDLEGRLQNLGVTDSTHVVYNMRDLSFQISLPNVGKSQDEEDYNGALVSFDGAVGFALYADSTLSEYFESRGEDWKDHALCVLNNVDLIYHNINFDENGGGFRIHTELDRRETLANAPITGSYPVSAVAKPSPIPYPQDLVVYGDDDGNPQPLVIPGSAARKRYEQDNPDLYEGEYRFARIPIYLDTSGLSLIPVRHITDLTMTVLLYYPEEAGRPIAKVAGVQLSGSERCYRAIDQTEGMTIGQGGDINCTFYYTDSSRIRIEAHNLQIPIDKPLITLAYVDFDAQVEGSNAVRVRNITLLKEPDPGNDVTRIELDSDQVGDDIFRPFGTLLIGAPEQFPRITPSGVVVENGMVLVNELALPINDDSGNLNLAFYAKVNRLNDYDLRVSLLWSDIAEFRSANFRNQATNNAAIFDCNKIPSDVVQQLLVTFTERQITDCAADDDVLAKLREIYDEPIDLSYVEISQDGVEPTQGGNGSNDIERVNVDLQMRGMKRGSSIILIQPDFVNALNYICNFADPNRFGSLHTESDIVWFLTGHDMVKMSHSEMGDSIRDFPAKNVDFIGIADGIGGVGQNQTSCPDPDAMTSAPAHHLLTQHTPNIDAFGNTYQLLLGIEAVLVAHEVGHVLNATHDDSLTDGAQKTLMASVIDETILPFFTRFNTKQIGDCISHFSDLGSSCSDL